MKTFVHFHVFTQDHPGNENWYPLKRMIVESSLFLFTPDTPIIYKAINYNSRPKDLPGTQRAHDTLCFVSTRCNHVQALCFFTHTLDFPLDMMKSRLRNGIGGGGCFLEISIYPFRVIHFCCGWKTD